MPFDPSKPFEIVEETPKETWSGVAKNTAIDAVKGMITLGEGVVGIVDFPTGNLVGKGLSKLGYDSASSKEILSEGYTDRRKQNNKEVSKAKGFFGTIEALIDHPSVAFGAIVESAPMTASGVAAARYVAVRMLGSALTANGIKAGSGAARTFATKFFANPKVQTKLVMAGAATEGVQTAGVIQEQGRQAGRDYNETVGPALAAGAGTAAIGGLTSKIPGLRDAEASLATAGIGGQFAVKKMAPNIAKGIVKEGPLEEMPQSAWEQGMTNVAMDKPFNQGIPEAAATGMIIGAAQGGGMITATELMNSFQADVQPIDKTKPSNLGTIAKNIAEVEKEIEAKEIIEEIAPIIGTPIIDNQDPQSNFAVNVPPEVNTNGVTTQGQELKFDPSQPYEVQYGINKVGHEIIKSANKREEGKSVQSFASGDDIVNSEIDQAVRLAENEKAKRNKNRLALPVGQGFELVDRGEYEHNQLMKQYGPALHLVLEEINNGQVSKSYQNENGETSPTVSTYPDWFKQRTVKAYNKKFGTKINLSKSNVTATINKVKNNLPLVGHQNQIWDYLQSVLKEKRDNNPQLVADQEFSNLEKEGFEFDQPRSVNVGNLNEGDQVVVLDKKGIPDKLTHKGTDGQGNIVLQDGVTMHVDEFDVIHDVIADKKGEPTPSQIEPTPSPESINDAKIEQNTPEIRQSTESQANVKPTDTGTSQPVVTKDGTESVKPIDAVFPGGDILVQESEQITEQISSDKTTNKAVHDYSNTQVAVKGEAAKRISDLGNKIPDSELYTEPNDTSYGREQEPHVTVRYGLATDNPADIKPLSELPPMKAKLGKVSIFETDKYDVVKAEVISDALISANKKVGELVDLPGETFKDYQPHATIAYVKKGEGKKYIGNTELEGQEIDIDSIDLTDRNGKTHTIRLEGKQSIPDEKSKTTNDTIIDSTGNVKEDAVAGVKLSQSTESQQTPLTAKQQKIFNRLQKTGRVNVVSAAEAEKILGDATVLSKDGRNVEAFTLPDSSVYLIQENIKDLWPVIRHEVAIHSRRLLLSNETFNKLLKSLEARQKDKTVTGDAIRDAMAKVPGSTNPDHYWDEVLAYLTTDAPKVGIVRRFIAMLKNTLVRMGFNPGMFTAADISALAENALRKDSGTSATTEFARDAKLSISEDKKRKLIWSGKSAIGSVKVQRIIHDGPTRFDVMPDGQAVIYTNKWADRQSLNRTLFRHVDKFLNHLPENTFIRVTDSKEDFNHIARGTHKGSWNGREKTEEGGLSVSLSPEFPQKYAYYVTGEVIGEGGDGEPLLRVDSVKTVGKLMSFDALRDDFGNKRSEKLKSLGFTKSEAKAMESAQIASAGPEGPGIVDYSPINPDIRYSLSTTDDYVENRAITKNYKNQVLQKVREAGRNIVGGLDKYLGATSTRLRKINPKIESKIRELDFRIGKNSADDVKAIQGMLQKAKAMTADDFKDWDYARKNGDAEKINELVDKYNLKAEYKNYRKTLDKIRAEAIDVGLDVGFIEEYSPRILKDAEGFLLAIGKEKDWDIISRRLKKRAEEIGISVHDMTPEMRADIISNMMHGGFGLSGPAGAKERKVKKIPPHLNQYYMHSDAALVSYLHSMRKAIEARRFFGKVPEKISTAKRNLHRNMTLLAEENKKPEPNEQRIEKLNENIAEYRREIEKYKYQRDFTENIGAYIDELLINKEITPEQENTLVALLTARFHEKGTHGLIQAYKNFSYIDTMGSPISAITQIGDLAWAVYENGWGATSRAVINSIRKSSRIVKEDVGIERIAQEFADSDTLSNAVAKVFKWVGLEKMDAIGKEAMLNGALEKFEKRAQTDPAKLKAEIQHMFEGETDSVISDLQNKKITDNVKFLIYSKLLDYQPVGLSEMSEMYLQAGNGRLFYMLKSYTLKQFDVFRRESYEKIKNGTKAEKIEAIRKTIYLAALLVLANAGADELKDLILGRKTSLSDRATDNVLRLFGVSKFVTWKARTDGAGSAMVRQILPPFKFIDSLSKDVVSAGDGKGLYTTQSVPIVGKLAYWHMGRGQTSRLELYEKRFSGEKKKLKEIKEAIEQDPKKAASYLKEMNRLSRINIFQKKLTKNKKHINELKKRQKLGMKVGDKIKKMEDERAEMIKQFLSGLN
jgi:hypothetical protein